MFDLDWILLAVLIAVLGVVLEEQSLVAISGLILSTTPFAWLWNRYALNRVEYLRSFSENRVYVGEEVELTLTVTNRKPLPLAWLKIDDRFPLEVPLLERKLVPAAVPEAGLLINLVSLRWYERVAWRYHLHCEERGFYFFGPVTLNSGDIFGFFSQERRREEQDRLIIYPEVRPLPELGFPGKQPFGDRTARQPIFEDPSRTVGVREYRPEDTLKEVHWKATARYQDIKVKVYEPTHSYHLVIFLNVATFAQPWLGIDPQLQEHVISVAASIASHAVDQRYPIGLIANGSVPQSERPIKVMPSRAPDQLRYILEALAAVTPFATSKIEDLLAAESPKIPWGSTLVVVTGVVTDELLAELGRLHKVGRRLVLVSLDEDFDEHPPGMTTYHLLQEVAFGSGRYEEIEERSGGSAEA